MIVKSTYHPIWLNILNRSQVAPCKTSVDSSTTFSSPCKINVPKGITIYKGSISNCSSPFRTPDKGQFQRPVAISRALSNSPVARNNFSSPRRQTGTSSPSLSTLTGISFSSVSNQRNKASAHFNKVTARGKPGVIQHPKTLSNTVISLSERSPPRPNNDFVLRDVAVPKIINNDNVILPKLSPNTVPGQALHRLQSSNDVVVDDVIELKSDDDDDEITILEPSNSSQSEFATPRVPLESSKGTTSGISKKTPKVSPRRSDLPPSLYKRERSRQNLNSIFESASGSESSNSCQVQSSSATTTTTAVFQTCGSSSTNQSSVNDVCDQPAENYSSTDSLSNSNISTNPPATRIVKVLVDDTSYQALINLGFKIIDWSSKIAVSNLCNLDMFFKAITLF